MTLLLLDLKKIFFCYSTALHSKQWSTSLWYFHTDCWLWLWWYTTSLPDWSIWNVPCMEGGAFFSLFLCFCSSPQEIINTLNLNWLDSWMKYDLKLHRKLGDSHAHPLVSTGKCHWPQCKDCSGILGKALLWGSSQFRWWNNQISNKSITWGRENAGELWCSLLIARLIGKGLVRALPLYQSGARLIPNSMLHSVLVCWFSSPLQGVFPRYSHFLISPKTNISFDLL